MTSNKTQEFDTRLDIACRLCGQINVVNIFRQDYANWQGNVLIQDAFPYLTASQREMLMTQTCASCWDSMFPEENEDSCE